MRSIHLLEMQVIKLPWWKGPFRQAYHFWRTVYAYRRTLWHLLCDFSGELAITTPYVQHTLPAFKFHLGCQLAAPFLRFRRTPLITLSIPLVHLGIPLTSSLVITLHIVHDMPVLTPRTMSLRQQMDHVKTSAETAKQVPSIGSRTLWLKDNGRFSPVSVDKALGLLDVTVFGLKLIQGASIKSPGGACLHTNGQLIV